MRELSGFSDSSPKVSSFHSFFGGMNNSRPNARSNDFGNGTNPIPLTRHQQPTFPNEAERNADEVLNPTHPPQFNGRGQMEAIPRDAFGVQEAVGHVARNPLPRLHRQQEKQNPAPHSDRVFPVQRNGVSMYGNEVNNSATPDSPSYIRDEDTPPNASPQKSQGKVKRKKKPAKPLVVEGRSKTKFGYSTCTVLITIQCILIFLFGAFGTYGDEATAFPKSDRVDEGLKVDTLDMNFHSTDHVRLHKFYPLFQDVHVMIFIGFGFLMTFLRKYGFSAVGYNMLIAAIAIQWSILCRGVFHYGFDTIPIDIKSLINGDFAAGSVLISFGALLGVTSPLQLVTLCLIEVFLYALNEYIGAEIYGAIDVGGSMWIHTFGAYFGLSLSLALRRSKDIDAKNEGSSYNSDIFAMIGTIFLWLFWPSFNGAMALGDDQHRAVLNTVLSLTGSCIFSFAASSLLRDDQKFNMVHIQNASLAGGVAVGAVADLMIQPVGALVIGSAAGLLSTAGYVYLTPFLQNKVGLHDTCGVHNLHGMPGVMAGIIGIIMAQVASEDMYGKSLYLQYPARAPVENSSEFKEIRSDLLSVEAGEGRTAQTQALFQLAALCTTLGIALVGGAVTGLLLRIPLFGKVPNESVFDDEAFWEIPEVEDKVEGNSGSESNGTHGTGNQPIETSPGKEE